MKQDDFYARLFKEIEGCYPSAIKFFKNPQALQFTWSPFVIKIDAKIFEAARQAVQEIWSLSRTPQYQSLLPEIHKEWLNLKNDSVLMAYDFHLNESGDLRLIEINTNASGYLTSALLSQIHSGNDTLLPLIRSFENEWQLVFGDQKLQSITIADKSLHEQKMGFEHVMFQDFFKSRGYESSVMEWSELTDERFIYNRHTDFYLAESDSQNLRKKVLTGEICLSPSPKEYSLLADKQRLADLAQASFDVSEPIRSVLLKTFFVQNFSREEVWQQRKQLIFKPTQSYGGKAVYRGASITKKVFDAVYRDNFLAQEFFAPATFNTEWKYDLRFYVYQNQIQHQTARIYQGQFTNFKTPLGGFARVEFVSN